MSSMTAPRHPAPFLALALACGALAPQVSAAAPTPAAGAVAQAAAQPAATTDDLFALQDAIYDAARDVAASRATDAAQAAQLQRELDQLRDEAVYLRVKARKDGGVSRAEIDAVRRRVEDVRVRARGESGPTRWGSVDGPAAAPAPTPAPAPAPQDQPRTSGWSDAPAPAPAPPASASGASTAWTDAAPPQPVRRPAGCGPYEVCVGQELDVRLQTALNSGTAQVEERFEATTIVSFFNEANELIPAGSLLQGVVSSVDRSGRTDRTGSLTLAFERITVRGRSYPIRATVTKAIESKGMRGEVGKIGVGAGVGAIIGGILGGVGGAVAGTVVGAGGILLATQGPEVTIPPGTILRIRFDAPVTIQ
jgi:hypothetical protein